jgi:hypothetical protein
MSAKGGDNVVHLLSARRPKTRTASTLRKQNADLAGQLLSMSMLLHAVVRRHGPQLFDIRAVESCDPKGVDVVVDYERDRVEVRLTPPDET